MHSAFARGRLSVSAVQWNWKWGVGRWGNHSLSRVCVSQGQQWLLNLDTGYQPAYSGRANKVQVGFQIRGLHGLSCAGSRGSGLRLVEGGRRSFQSSGNGRPYKGGATVEQLERMEIMESGNEDSPSVEWEGRRQDRSGVKGEVDQVRGKLLTTPSRLLKLLIPLPTEHPGDVETIAILIHSQQPLSYLERLIQAEVPPVKAKDGCERAPGISFVAFQCEDDPIRPRKATQALEEVSMHPPEEVDEDAVVDDRGHGEETREPPEEKLNTGSYLRQTQSGKGNTEQRYVRWSHATEIGDFIRDAARAGEFIVAIEGAEPKLSHIRVTVPSFEERTHFLRMRLRKISGRIQQIARIKHECDALAHRGAQRVAIGGFGVLAFWWYLVYRLTFETDLGWDTMEPVTYLASLSTLMGGYLWFLYHNREISYRSALDFTINARQKKLYQLKGVDLQLWENLIDEGNTLRREIKTIAAEYDTEWDEKQDEQDESVTEALRHERAQKKKYEDERDKEKGKDD